MNEQIDLVDMISLRSEQAETDYKPDYTIHNLPGMPVLLYRNALIKSFSVIADLVNQEKEVLNDETISTVPESDDSRETTR